MKKSTSLIIGAALAANAVCFVVYAAGHPFKVMKLGNNYRINKASFDKWFNSASLE